MLDAEKRMDEVEQITAVVNGEALKLDGQQVE